MVKARPFGMVLSNANAGLQAAFNANSSEQRIRFLEFGLLRSGAAHVIFNGAHQSKWINCLTR